jgi:hypothetical protein
MEIALLLGLTGTYAPEPLRSRLPALDRDTIVMLGQRDHLYRRQIGVPTIAGQVVLHPLEELRGDPVGIATDAAEYLVRHAHGWWLHIDLDVLAGSEFPACDAATDPAIPGGLTWTELVTVTTAALRTGGCRGCSIGRLQHRPRFRRTRGHAHRGLRRRRRRPCPARVSKPMPGAEGRPACARRRLGHGNTLVPSPWQATHSGGLALSGSHRPSAGTAGAADPGAGGSGAVCRLPSPAGCGIRPTTRRRSRDISRLIWPPARESSAGAASNGVTVINCQAAVVQTWIQGRIVYEQQ